MPLFYAAMSDARQQARSGGNYRVDRDSKRKRHSYSEETGKGKDTGKGKSKGKDTGKDIKVARSRLCCAVYAYVPPTQGEKLLTQ